MSIVYQSSASEVQIFVADCYFEELVWGGEWDGISFYRGYISIGDHALTTVDEIIPYRAHLNLPAFDMIEADGEYASDRLGVDADGTQINIEFQIFLLLNGRYYQEYIVDNFIIENGNYNAENTAAKADTAATPISLEFALLPLMVLPVIVIYNRKKGV